MLCVNRRPWAPGAGRTHIGKYQTKLTEPFWRALVDAAGIELNLRKCRGDNAHHIVEATFKSFARCLRATMDQMEAGASTNLYTHPHHSCLSRLHPYVFVTHHRYKTRVFYPHQVTRLSRRRANT